MKINKNEWYINKKEFKRYVHEVKEGKDGRLVVIYSSSGLEKDKKETLYGSFLSWINK